MLLSWFKRKYIRAVSIATFKQQIKIMSSYQQGNTIDFIIKSSKSKVICLFDLTTVLKSEEHLRNVQLQAGDPSVYFSHLMIQDFSFSIHIGGGKLNSKSGIALTITTTSDRVQQFTILLSVLHRKEQYIQVEKNNSYLKRLWSFNQNPNVHLPRFRGEELREGDMVINESNHMLWEYRLSEEGEEWFQLFTLTGPVTPVDLLESKIQRLGVDLQLNSILSDQGKIRSNGKGGLTVKGFVRGEQCDAMLNTITVGKPLGNGAFFSLPGMISAESLFIASSTARPRNSYIGVGGVVSAKTLSADYIQLAPLSVKELPKQTRTGTMVLCEDYPNMTKPVLLIALKENPNSFSDWNLVNSSTTWSKPYLFSISDPEVDADETRFQKKIVKMKAPSSTDKNNPINTYTHIQMNQLSLPSSEKQNIIWNQLYPGKQYGIIKGEGRRYWQFDSKCWQVPYRGLLHVDGWITFTEDDNSKLDLTPYHANDRFILYVCIEEEKNNREEGINWLEIPLVPYENKETQKRCISSKINFSTVIPVSEGKEITFYAAYMLQGVHQCEEKIIQIEHGSISFYMN